MMIPEMSCEIGKNAYLMEKAPRWAILERQVFTVLSQAPKLLEKYLNAAGGIIWPESVRDFQTFADANMDNAFEGFQNFPLLYILGGSESLLEYSQREYDALTDQFSGLKRKLNLGIPEAEAVSSGRDRMIVDGMFPDMDWMHRGEGAQFLYHLYMADPSNAKNRGRLMYAAQVLFGDNPAGYAKNYDPEHRVFTCCYMGPNGPAYERYKQPFTYADWMDWYGLPFYDVPGMRSCWDLKIPGNAVRFGQVYRDRLSHSDSVTGMLSTSLAAIAYAISGDETYCGFVKDYTGAWRERADKFEYMPDNAGPSGIVGETLGGRFCGGHYGWIWPHGLWFIEDAMIVGGENERLLTGRKGTLDWAKELYDKLIDNYGIQTENGETYIPQKHTDGDTPVEYQGNPQEPMTDAKTASGIPHFVRYLQRDGWYQWKPCYVSHWGHIYAASRSGADYERMKAVFPEAAFEISPEPRYPKYKGGDDLAFIRYLRGEDPGYPEAILGHMTDIYFTQNASLYREQHPEPGADADYPESEEKKTLITLQKELREKYSLNLSLDTVHNYYTIFVLSRSPLSVEGLLQLTMGAMSPVYNGGLLCAEIRWFDLDRCRPGLCEGTAALVREIGDYGVTVELANTDSVAHHLVMQGGAYGEHNIVSVEAGQDKTAVNSKWVSVVLPAGTAVTLRAEMERWTNKPSYEEPYRTAAYGRPEASN